MTKKKKDGEQLNLIDVAPENAKPIIEAARLYKGYQSERLAALKKEIEQKTLIIELVKKADLQTLAGGKIRFEYDDVLVTITPRDELVKVTDKAKDAEPEPEEE